MTHTHDDEAATDETKYLQCEECQVPLWKAGEVVPAGTYVRVDDRSYRPVILRSSIKGNRCRQHLMGMWRCIVPLPARAGMAQAERVLLPAVAEEEMH
jgi:hypothetical protein